MHCRKIAFEITDTSIKIIKTTTSFLIYDFFDTKDSFIKYYHFHCNYNK